MLRGAYATRSMVSAMDLIWWMMKSGRLGEDRQAVVGF